MACVGGRRLRPSLAVACRVLRWTGMVSVVSVVSVVTVVTVVTVVSIPSMDWAGRWTLVWRGALATIRRTNPQTNHHAVSAVRVVSAVQTEEKREKT